MNLPLDCHEPGYQMKVFTLYQSLTRISCKQGSYRFLTIELVKTAIDQKQGLIPLIYSLFFFF